ncbi:MAG: isoleucine--tRNA ligase [Nanoarchaeota archaeon]|nr:isoleucine--tRNA ligase [Nanoarchaeota archaeon]
MYQFKEVEEEIRKNWKKIKLLDKLEKKNSKGKNYFLLDGPPYANFVPHVGHIRNTVLKDLNIRLAFMKGRNVFFQPGFDTHGLPIENMVEKKLGLKSKKDIEKLGIGKFTAECKKWAAINKDLWMKVYDLLGSWYSWKEPYLTYENYYLESGWWTFKNLWEKDLIYEGKKAVTWCPKCETALAGYEVTDSYKNLTDPIIFVKFKIKNKDEYFLVFTTTPWTLMSNVAIAAHPEGTYVKVETAKGVLILAEAGLKLLEEWEMGYKILKKFRGAELDGMEYEPLLDVPIQRELEKNPNALKVYMSIPILKERVASKVAAKKDVGESRDVFEDFVNTEDGTGLVHVAPGHGSTDNEVGRKYNLPSPSPLDNKCKYTEDSGEYEGVFVKDADNDIIELLIKEDKMVHHSTKEHSYPVCWRCKTPLIFRMSNQWFLRIDEVRNQMLKENEKVRWLPNYADERFKSWVSNAIDWNISRQRYWDIPIPLWKCECGNLKVVGSFEELKNNAVEKVTKEFDLHNASKIKLKCKCGKKMKRVDDIFDVWFDSGIAPWASLGYPFKNKELFEKNFPVNRINESQDQIRGWFYYLMVCGVANFDKAPYEEVSMPGWVLDEKGEKMSKSLGNVIQAEDGLKEFGADALRLYYMWDVSPYELEKFSVNVVKKEIASILNILWNIHNYLLSFDVKEKVKIKEVEDKWLISRMNSLIKEYDKDLDKFEYKNATRNLINFIVDNVSREYIQYIRNRDDNVVGYVLKEAMVTALKLLAPITPFVTDKIYQDLKDKLKLKNESIHLEDWPKSNEKLIDKRLEDGMENTREIIQEILAQREKNQIGVRWPLSKVTIQTKDLKVMEALELFETLILRQTNIKELVLEEEKTSGKFKLEIETKMDKDLLAEGFSREMMRRVQDLRKKAKLSKEDEIDLVIVDHNNILKKFEKDIKEKVGAKEIEIGRSEKKKYEFEEEFKIRDKRFKIGLKKL